MAESEVAEAGLQPSLNIHRDPGASFVQKSHLAYIVPSRTDLDLDEVFKNIEQGGSILDTIKQRDTLFFGKYWPPYL
jgi:hypothetical protein